MARVRQTGLTPVSYEIRWMPAYYGGVVYNTYNNSYYLDSCEDLLGYPTDHTLWIKHREWTGNKTNWEGTTLRIVDQDGFGQVKYPAGADFNRGTTAMNDVTTARVVAQSGPVTPKVFLLTNLLEAAEIPAMLKHAGDLLHKLATNPASLSKPAVAASTTLAYQFGWGPLIQDIGRMLNFADLVAARQRELEKLYSGKGIRKKLFTGNSDSRQEGNQVLASTGGMYINPHWVLTQQHHTWATIHWKLRDPSQIGKKPTWQDAFRSVYGLSGGSIPVQIWKALPWSWAIDWFTDISNHLLAIQNQVLFKPSNVNVMCTTHGSLQWQAYQTAANRKFGGTAYDFVYKQRQPRTLGSLSSINLRIPHLDAFKLSVLGSFAVLALL